MRNLCITSFICFIIIFNIELLNSLHANCSLTGSVFFNFEKEKYSIQTLEAKGAQEKLIFLENKGQITDNTNLHQPAVKFLFQQGNTQLFFLKTGIAYQFTKTDYPKDWVVLLKDKSDPKSFEKLLELQKQIRKETYRMDMVLVNANPNAVITTEGKSTDYTNYYNRNVLDVHSYSKITYHDIYPGIDWVIYTSNGKVKYDFIIKPGSDPSRIKMEFKHYEDLTLNEDGSFTLKNSLGSITEKRPVSFQGEEEISTKFSLNNNCISFQLGNYNLTKELVIDPSLIWSTYYGGSDVEDGSWCATDNLGNVYISGDTESQSNIASAGHQVVFGGGGFDAILVKFNSSGIRQWATYYGGDGSEFGHYCTTDLSGNVFLAGPTTSTSNISSSGHQNLTGGNVDGFLVKFNSSGTRLWATYYGGVSTDVANSCCTDNLGNVYLAGSANSVSNISSSGFQNTFGGMNDAFLVKFDATGLRLWSTYYGGVNSDFGYSCVTDVSGNVYLAGSSASTSNISSSGHQNTYGGGITDAFLVKFSSSGSRLWASYYGGAGNDNGYFCNTDVSGNVYLGGDANSTSNIAASGHQNSLNGGGDGYLVKFSSAGTRLWGTYYGGNGSDEAFSCATDGSNNVYLMGVTNSTASIASGGFQNSYGGNGDAYVVKFSSAGLRIWGSYFGSTDPEYGNAIAVDVSGNFYLVGATSSSTGIASGGHQNTYGGGNSDVFLAKFCDSFPGQAGSILGNSVVCSSSQQVYSVSPIFGATSYSWNVPTGWSGTSTTNSIILAPSASGSIVVFAMNTCGNGPAQTLNVLVNPSPTLQITGNSSVCEGLTITQIVNGSAVSYTWSNGSNGNVATFTPSATTIYTVTGANSFGCTNYVSKTITVNANPQLLVTSSSGVICSGESQIINVSGASYYFWNDGSNGTQLIITPTITTTYSVTGTDINGCNNSATYTQTVDVCAGIIPSLQNNNTQMEIFPNPNNGILQIKFNKGGNTELIIYNTFGEKVLDVSIIQNLTPIDISSLADGMYLVVFSHNNEVLKKVKMIKQ